MYAGYSSKGAHFKVMDFLDDPCNVVSFVSLLLALILDAYDSIPMATETTDDAGNIALQCVTEKYLEVPVIDALSIAGGALHNFRLSTTSFLMSDDMAFWVKPRSTTWFSRFLLEQYDDSRWLSVFRMTKSSMFLLADFLAPHV